MNVNIFYASWYGNGKKIVEELAKILMERKQDVAVFSIMEKSDGKIPDADFYIFSSPTRKFSLPTNVKEFISNFIPPRNRTRYALMTTYMDPRTIGLKRMETVLDSKGMLKAASDLKIKSLGIKGPLEKEYGKKLVAFADEILKL
jgi:flavorubredoxin